MEEELLDALVKLGYLDVQDRAQGGARLLENRFYLAGAYGRNSARGKLGKCCNL